MNTGPGGLARIAPSFRQLLGLATRAIEDDRGIDDAEWSARIKDLASAQGFAASAPTAITEAMRTIERTKARAWGPRPVPLPRSAIRA